MTEFENDVELQRYIEKLGRSKKRRDRVMNAAEGTPRIHNGRPHTIHNIDGFEVHMKRFADHAEHGVRVDVQIYRDGVLVHEDDHVVINPPSIVIHNGTMTDNPVLALAHTVLEASRVKAK